MPSEKENVNRAKAYNLRCMLESAKNTEIAAVVRHPYSSGRDEITLDAAALRVLIAHYSMPERAPRPAWLEPETIDAPRPVRGSAVDRE